MGLLAALAGLIFVGLEIRQNNRLAQASAYQEIGFATAQSWYDVSQDPDFDRVYLRHFYSGWDWCADQDPRDVERLMTLGIGHLRQYEILYLQVDLGLLDKAALERLGWGFVRDITAVRTRFYAP